MATARERLMQLSVAQQEAQEFAQRSEEFSKPTGGGILQRPVRPSEAGQLDAAKGTPFVDFGEHFLNQLGITSKRQRIAQAETGMAIDEANKTMIAAAREQMGLVARRGASGIDAERLQEVNTQLESAAKLLDNPVPEIQDYGRAQIQSAVNSLDAISVNQAQFLDKQREGMQTRIRNLFELDNQELRINDEVFSILNNRGERNGFESKLSSFEKQIVANYANGTSFRQTQGEEGFSIPGFAVPYDPAEVLTVGDATTLIEDISLKRRMTIADQVARENKLATEVGFKLNNKDGRWDVDEIAVPELGQEVERLRYGLPAGQPLNIQPGLPTAEDVNRTVESRIENVAGFGRTVGEIGRRSTPFLEPVRNATTDLFEFIGRDRDKKPQQRGGTGIVPIQRETN